MAKTLIKKEENLEGQGLNKKITVLVILVVALVLAGFYGFKPEYRAVYMTTGELYLGKYYAWPQAKLVEARLLQVTQDEERPFVLSRFSESLWQPAGDVYINRKQIVWTAPIALNSEMINFLAQEKQVVSEVLENNNIEPSAPSSE